MTSVKFYINGALVRSDSLAPYSWSWDTTGTDNGTVQVLARAYDAAGNEGTSQTVTVTVSNPTAVEDTTPPTVSILNPNATTVSGTVQISISASDNVAVASVSFHTIMAVAEDTSGNTASTSVQVEVVKSGGNSSGGGSKGKGKKK